MKRLDIEKNIINSQLNYISQTDKNYIKEHSQFFTPIPVIKNMINTVDFKKFNTSTVFRILEPSAGCGILVCFLMLHILEKTNIKSVEIDLYESDISLGNMLIENISMLSSYISLNSFIKFTYKIHFKNFLLASPTIVKKYDIIISNPPFKKINKTSKEASIFSEYIYGQPNIYMLFMLASLKLLSSNGIYTVITPRSYLSGLYAKKIRAYILNNYHLSHLHTFDSRHIFKNICQEVIISTFSKNANDKIIKVSHNGSFSTKLKLKNLICKENNYTILLPRTLTDIQNIGELKIFNSKLDSLNLTIKVGPVVQFRQTEFLRTTSYSSTHAPLMLSSDIGDNNIIAYNSISSTHKPKNHSISTTSPKIVKNSNYLLLQKVTSKSAKNFIKAVVLPNTFFNHSYIGFDNNLLYIRQKDISKPLDLTICYGLYCYLSSSLFNNLFSLIIGTHTINVQDFNDVPFPNYKQLLNLGTTILKSKDYSRDNCDKLISTYTNK